MKGKIEDTWRNIHESIEKDPGYYVEKWTKNLTSDGTVYKETNKKKAAEVTRICAGMGLIFGSPFFHQEEENLVLKKEEYQLFINMNFLYGCQMWEANNIMYNSLKFAMNGHYNMANSLLRNTFDLVLSASVYNMLSHHTLFTIDDNERFESTFLSVKPSKECSSCGEWTHEKDNDSESTDTANKSFMFGARLEPRLKENFEPLFKYLLNEKERRHNFLNTFHFHHYLALSGKKCSENPVDNCIPELELGDLSSQHLYSLNTTELAKQLGHYDLLKPFSNQFSLKNHVDYDELCRNIHERVGSTDVARQMFSKLRATFSEEEDSEEEESDVWAEYLPKKFEKYYTRATRLTDTAAVIFVNMINAWLVEIDKRKEDQEPEIRPDVDFILIEKIYSKILGELFTLKDYFKDLGLKKTEKRIDQLKEA